MFRQAKQTWLQTFLELPPHDTFGRVFRRINPEAFEACFGEWTQALCSRMVGEVGALDGKQLRRLKDRVRGHEGMRLASTWAGDNALIRAQAPVVQGSNEIPTLLRLLELLDLSASMATLMGSAVKPRWPQLTLAGQNHLRTSSATQDRVRYPLFHLLPAARSSSSFTASAFPLAD